MIHTFKLCRQDTYLYILGTESWVYPLRASYLANFFWLNCLTFSIACTCVCVLDQCHVDGPKEPDVSPPYLAPAQPTPIIDPIHLLELSHGFLHVENLWKGTGQGCQGL